MYDLYDFADYIKDARLYSSATPAAPVVDPVLGALSYARLGPFPLILSVYDFVVCIRVKKSTINIVDYPYTKCVPGNTVIYSTGTGTVY